MYIPDTTDLLKPGTIRDFCDSYAESVAEVDAAFLSLARAHDRMARLIQRFNVIPDNLHDLDMTGEAERPRKQSAAMMQKSAWNELVKLTGVLDVMTQKKRDEFYKNVESGNVPPVTYENVMALLNGMRGDIGKIVDEAIAEAARVLRPHDHYKTNSAWKLGKRAIITYAVSFSFGSFNLSHSRTGDIQTIDNAFHLLDGKGVPAHPHRLQDTIYAAIKAKVNTCETPLFRVKWHQCGTMHLEFLRSDLVDELNRRSADHRTLRSEVA